jgi:hypothetical protein
MFQEMSQIIIKFKKIKVLISKNTKNMIPPRLKNLRTKKLDHKVP